MQKETYLVLIFLLLLVPFSSAVLMDNPFRPLIKTAAVSTSQNITVNASAYWVTSDRGSLGAVSDIMHNWLSGLQGGASGEYYHLDNTDYTYLTTNLFSFLTTASLTNFHDQDLNTTDRVVFQTLNLTCGPYDNKSCLNVSGDITVRDIYARDGFFANNTIYIGDTIKLSASGVNGGVLNISGGNVSADVYFGSGEALTNLNLSGISFDGDTIIANNFTGNFYGNYDWVAEAPWLNFNGTYLYFNESKLKSDTEVTLQTQTINITSVGGIGSATTTLLDFEIKQIDVVASSGTKFRFEATETLTGNFIDRNRKLHTSSWSIEKNYPINDTVDLSITSANPDDTFQITIKYLNNFA